MAAVRDSRSVTLFTSLLSPRPLVADGKRKRGEGQGLGGYLFLTSIFSFLLRESFVFLFCVKMYVLIM